MAIAQPVATLKIFPLHGIHEGRCACTAGPACRNVGKHPLVAWRTYSGGERGPGGGYGIPTGSVNGLVVVDCDVSKGHPGIANFLALGHVPKTATVGTPSGGRHYYFRTDLQVRNSASKLAPGVDVRGEGGFVVGPESPGKTGVYTLLVDVDPAPLPDWLAALLAPGQCVAAVRTDGASNVCSPDRVRKARDYLSRAPACVEDGQSSARLLRVCARLRSLRLPVANCLELLEEYNARCVPPWPLADLERALRSVDTGPVVPNAVRESLVAERTIAALAGRVTEHSPSNTAPHVYAYLPGMRTQGEIISIDFRELLADLYDHRAWSGVLRYDAFRGRVRAVRPPVPLDAEGPSGLSDADVDGVRGWLEYQGRRARREDVRAALEQVARRNVVQPVQDWLRGLAWDGLERLPSVLPDLFQSPDGDYERAIGVRWFVSLVARAMQPGCQSDCTLILEGPQGIGKTSAFRALMHDPTWYAESSAGVDSKDFFENLRGVWLMGFDELDSLARGSLTRVKTVLTSVSDRYRQSYGRSAQDYPRTCGFCGTTNQITYFHDATGGRRFWPVRVTRTIDTAAIVAVRDQLWAEARVRFERHESWHLDTDALRALAEGEQAERHERDPWEATVSQWLNDPARVSFEPLDEHATGGLPRYGLRRYDASQGVTTAAALEHAIGRPAERQTNADAQRVANALRAAGWGHRRHLREGSTRVWRYHRE
jgi:hypothetical protein